MYVPNDFSDRIFKAAPPEKKIYRLKKDLECSLGTFIEGTKVYVEFLFNGNNMAYYHITASEGAKDGITFKCTNNEELESFKKWVEETFESAEGESRQCEELLEKYEKETASLKRACEKKQSTLLVCIFACIAIGIIGMALSCMFDLGVAVVLTGVAFTAMTGIAGTIAYYAMEDGKQERLRSLESTFNKSFAGILE